LDFFKQHSKGVKRPCLGLSLGLFGDSVKEPSRLKFFTNETKAALLDGWLQ
jgi:hypothetical protein